MLNITKATRSQRWVEYGDERYLIRFTPTFSGLIDNLQLAQEIIVDWENAVVGADGSSLPCTKDVLTEFVKTDEGMERLLFLMREAASQKGFTNIEALLKNLTAPSSGASTGQALPPNGAKNASENVNLQSNVKTVH